MALSMFAPSMFANQPEEAALKALADYDEIMRKRSEGPISETDSTAMTEHLKSALSNYKQWKATPEAAAGSEKLAKAMASHYNDFTVAGIFMFQSQDYQGAYSIWEACVDVPDDPEVAANLKNMQNSRGELAYNRAIAASQAGMLRESLGACERAYILGFSGNQLFDSAIMTALQLKLNDTALDWCRKGNEKFGPTSVYREHMIKIATESNPAEGVALATETIGIDPENPKWYNLRAIANEKLKNHKAVLEDLRHIAETRPQDGMAMYNYGNKLMFMAGWLRSDKKAKKEDINRMREEAVAAFEKVCQMPKDEGKNKLAIQKSINYLDQLYHQNGDKAGRKRVQKYREELGIVKQ